MRDFFFVFKNTSKLNSPYEKKSFLLVHAEFVCAHGHVWVLWAVGARTICAEISMVEKVHHPAAICKKILIFALKLCRLELFNDI
jgi:hypothetical protein